jgi:hypothetical protein
MRFLISRSGFVQHDRICSAAWLAPTPEKGTGGGDPSDVARGEP